MGIMLEITGRLLEIIRLLEIGRDFHFVEVTDQKIIKILINF